MTRTFGSTAAQPSPADANECMSVEDLHPDQTITSLRGSSGASEGALSAASKEGTSGETTNVSEAATAPEEIATRSGRVSKPVEQINIAAFAIDTYLDELENKEIETAPWTMIQAMGASANPDILYFHEAMKAPDKEKFILAMEEEVRTHSEGKHWKVVPRSTVPSEKRVLPSV